MSVQSYPNLTATVLVILRGVLGVVREMNWLDNPLDIDEVFRIVADGQRLDPGPQALVHAKAAMDAGAFCLIQPDSAVVDRWIAGDYNALIERLLFEQGKAGLVSALTRAIEQKQIEAMQPMLWSVK